MLKSNSIGLLALGLASLVAASCTKEPVAGSPSSSDNGNVTNSDPSGVVKAPKATAVTKLPALLEPVSTTTFTNTVKAETPASPPSPEVMAAVSATQTKLTTLTTSIEGTRVRFVDCTASASCTSRVEAQTLAGLRDLLQAASSQQGGINFVAREQLDAYTGHSYVADVTTGGTSSRPVPADENELLGNNNDGT